MRLIGYVRVSTTGQVKDGLGMPEAGSGSPPVGEA
jgi:DNA invertase Pin-like site-specific DNA recombinase